MKLPVKKLFDKALLKIGGSELWGEPIPETASGVYVITVSPHAARVPKSLRDRWNEGEEVVYIGRAKHLRRRLGQFYRHVHGASGPHKGGQDIKRLGCDMRVHWSAQPDYAGAERRLIEAFAVAIGRFPFGNRVKSAKMGSIPRKSGARKNGSRSRLLGSKDS